ncbi:MAG: hypothetical protein ACREXS_00400 [Gammaproteobacteria bacterium]
MEKANVVIESARVAQVTAEVTAARESWKLAQGIAASAQRRFRVYSNLDEHIRDLEGDAFRTSAKRSLAGAFPGGISSGALGAIGGILDFSGTIGAFGTTKEMAETQTARVQRSYEKENLSAAISETAKAASVAEKQYGVAQAGFTVSCLQRQAALLRHESAIQNLKYLRNRTLNAEQWFRLANAIRGVADTYLRYAIELAFLSDGCSFFRTYGPTLVVCLF